jgi:hypothetical protein
MLRTSRKLKERGSLTEMHPAKRNTDSGAEEGQFKTGKLGGAEATMSELWNAALAA